MITLYASYCIYWVWAMYDNFPKRNKNFTGVCTIFFPVFFGCAPFFFFFLDSFYTFVNYTKKQKKESTHAKEWEKWKKIFTNQVPQKTVQMTKQKNTEFTSWTLGLTWTQYAIPWARKFIWSSRLIPITSKLNKRDENYPTKKKKVYNQKKKKKKWCKLE